MIPCSVLLYGLDDAELLGINADARGRIRVCRTGRMAAGPADARRGARRRARA